MIQYSMFIITINIICLYIYNNMIIDLSGSQVSNITILYHIVSCCVVLSYVILYYNIMYMYTMYNIMCTIYIYIYMYIILYY